MTKKVLQGIGLLAAAAGLMWAQDAAPAAGAPAAPQPSQDEIKAFQKVNETKDADSRIKAADEFIAAYPTGPLTSYVMEMAGEANQVKGDSTKAVYYYEESLKLDPKNYNAMLMIAAETAQHTREFDIDRDQKLTRAKKLVNDALVLIPAAEKPNPQITDQQWEDAKKDDMARGHTALGIIAMAEQKYPEAVTQFQASIDAGSNPDPVVQIRLGNALNEAKRPDEAMAVLDKVIGMPNLPQNLKDFAQNEKKRSQQIKAAAK